ncbi:MAG: AAA family ATPase [Patescibacteria group bacterium]
MLLKRLELQGFKSFADRTVLDLSHQVTAIVGPNGSGKSNITDSIRWLLGERDARNLRGGKGEDLIFAGTKNKPRAGQAQATLHFNNASGFFPVDYKDVTISRKVTRDGASNFSINKSEVRLKDVIEFFAKSKVGARGLSIISQGESDVFIKATPQERREMIEEILGLKEYQIKKIESQRKLKNTNFNLEKARALIEELGPHLRLLRRQVKRYEGREDAEEELRILEDYFYGTQLKEFEKGIQEVSRERQKIDVALVEENNKLIELQKNLDQIKGSEPKSAEELKKIKIEEDKLYRKKAELQMELGKIEVRLELAKSNDDVDPAKSKDILIKVRNISKKLISEGSLDKVRSGLDEIIKLIESLGGSERQGSEEFEKLHKDIQAELKKLNDILESYKKDEGELSEGLQSFNENFTKAYELVARQQSRVSELVGKKNEHLVKKERFETRLESLVDELKQIGRLKDSLGVGAENPPAGEAGVDLSDGEIRQKMLRIRSQLASIGEVDESIVKEAKEVEERYAFLTNQVEDLDKAIVDLKGLIVELDKRIHGDFNSAIEKIDKEFNKLVQLVFGGGKASLKLEKIKKSNEEAGELGVAKAIQDGSPDASKEAFREEVISPGVLVDITLPKKRIKGLEVLSGGERALVSIAALFALISISAPPFLFLDEVDAALDERNAKRFGEILKEFSKKTQFVIVTHSRATMEAADVLYGVTMSNEGTSKLVSIKLT